MYVCVCVCKHACAAEREEGRQSVYMCARMHVCECVRAHAYVHVSVCA
jgi:hypothetical protein